MVTCSAALAAGSRRVRLARRRLLAACMVSAGAHLWFAGGMPAGSPRSAAPGASAPVITARLAPLDAPQPEALPVLPVVPAETAPASPRAQRTPESARDTLATARAEPDAGPGHAMASDPRYYAVRELDVYPALAAPLELRAVIAPAARALLMVLIDARGGVDQVDVVEADAGGAFGEEARRSLLAARFTPALKNGRPVKSRVLIRIEQDGEGAAR